MTLPAAPPLPYFACRPATRHSAQHVRLKSPARRRRETEEGQLIELFSTVRPPLKASIERGRQGRSRGFAIVEYASAMDALAAMQALNGANANVGRHPL